MKEDFRLEQRAASKLSSELVGATGVVRIQIFLKDDSEAVIAELKKLGFTVIAKPRTAKLIIGRISADKLKQLSELAAVRYISPAK